MTPRLAVLVAAAALAAPTGAWAHAHLVRSVPGAGATVPTAPEIAITFSEAIVPAFSGVELADAEGHAVGVGKATGAGKTLTVPVPGPLQPGAYVVRWHAVSVDSHKTQGSFRFTLKP